MQKKNPIRDIPLDPPPCQGYPTHSVENRLDWSAAQNSCPTWLRDAKFGIFFHWGPYSVAEFQNEWYSRNMYREDLPAHRHHVETYGSIQEFGYKNLINQFTGEHFDAERWVRLFRRAGARYFIACAEHCDGFSMWDSAVNPCNSVNYGIGRDVIAELKMAADKLDMKFGASLHHSWNWGWFCSTDSLADVYNPKNALFYGNAVPYSASKDFPTYIMPDDAFQQNWLAKCKEVVDKCLPDTLYFDGRLYIIDEKYRLEFARYYLDAARRAGKEVVVTYKDKDWHETAGMLDFECHWMEDILPQPWQGDDKMVWRTWSYIKDGEYKTPKQLIHQMVDYVSKNGNFLLNIGPKKDGTFDENTIANLEAIGDWLTVNGEAIYDTRPFRVYGEGPTRQQNVRGPSLPEHLLPFTAEDIRFTQKDGVLYAILLGWPYAGKVSIQTLRAGGVLSGAIKRVCMLGCDAPLHFVQDAAALTVTLPKEQPCREAFVLKIAR